MYQGLHHITLYTDILALIIGAYSYATGYKMPTTSNSAWSYSLRGREDATDSESDINSPAINRPTENISEDAKLALDLDLASRHDEAFFKPTPWTIAKVNAATRTSLPENAKREFKRNSSQSDTKKQPRGRIVDGLKKQLQRSTSQVGLSGLKPQRFRTNNPPKKQSTVSRFGSLDGISIKPSNLPAISSVCDSAGPGVISSSSGNACSSPLAPASCTSLRNDVTPSAVPAHASSDGILLNLVRHTDPAACHDHSLSFIPSPFQSLGLSSLSSTYARCTLWPVQHILTQ